MINPIRKESAKEFEIKTTKLANRKANPIERVGFLSCKFVTLG